MSDKKLERKKYKALREKIDFSLKEEKDNAIFEKVINLKEFIESDIILTYVTMGFEVDTLKLINYCLEKGKTVYVPFVTKEKMVMKFYKFTSFDDLVLNKFGTLEPLEKDEWLDFLNTLCIVPAIAYDVKGFRIGYGGGYYDYFLANHKVKTVGIMYDEFIIDRVVVDEFDVSVDRVVSEKRVIELQ